MSEVKIDLNNLDKSNWKTYRFDEIAKNISERVDPNNTDLQVYIGLEHIDSESLHIKRHGSPDDVNGTKLKFYKGDIIFGRRRAYQRKAGIATWDGFCSAHALVLRANPDVIDPELFPFFLHSDLFMNRAIDISVGSLSPTINWGTLKHQEFLIPPLELQKYYSKLFWSSNQLIENELGIIHKKHILKQCLQKKHFQCFENEKSVLVGDIAKLTAGGTPSTQVPEYWENGTVLWLSSGEVHKKRVFSTEKKITEDALKNSSAKLIPVHSCLIALAGQGKTKGTVAISEVELSTNQSVAAIMPDESKVEPYYLYHNLDSRYHDFRHITGKQNSRTGLNLKILKEFRIAFHDKDERESIQRVFNQLDESISVAEQKLQSSHSLQKTLVNKVF